MKISAKPDLHEKNIQIILRFGSPFIKVYKKNMIINRTMYGFLIDGVVVVIYLLLFFFL